MATAHPYRWAMLTGLWLIYFSFGLTTTSLAPLVGPITEELGLSHTAMGGVLGAWPLIYIVAAIPSGALLDRFGLRASFGLAAAIIGLSGLLRSVATGHLTLYLAVAVFGLGGAFVSVGAPKLISLWFAGKERGLAMGLYITGSSLGNVAALSLTNSLMMPMVGGRWRRVLLCYAVLALTAAVVWWALSAHRVSRALERRAASEARRSPVVGGHDRSRVASFMSEELQVFAELVSAGAVQILLVMAFGIFFFNHGLNSWLPEILRRGGMDARAAGFWASIPTVVGIGGALVVPRLALPDRRPAILFTLFACAGGATLLVHSPAGALLALGLTLQGIARTSMTAVSMLVMMDMREVAGRHVGAAGGLFFSAGELGGVLGPLTIGIIYDLTDGFAAVLDVLTGVCAALIALLWALGRTSARPRPAAS